MDKTRLANSSFLTPESAGSEGDSECSQCSSEQSSSTLVTSAVSLLKKLHAPAVRVVRNSYCLVQSHI